MLQPRCHQEADHTNSRATSEKCEVTSSLAEVTPKTRTISLNYIRDINRARNHPVT